MIYYIFNIVEQFETLILGWKDIDNEMVSLRNKLDLDCSWMFRNPLYRWNQKYRKKFNQKDGSENVIDLGMYRRHIVFVFCTGQPFSMDYKIVWANRDC